MGSRQNKDSPSCLRRMGACFASPCTLCTLRIFSWVHFVLLLFLSQVFLVVFFLLVVAELICAGGANAISLMEGLVNEIRKIPGQHDAGENAQDLITSMSLQTFCAAGSSTAGSSMTFYTASLFITMGQAFMASCLNGEKIRVEEEAVYVDDFYSDHDAY